MTRLLIAEDKPELRKMQKVFLERAGYVVVEAENGEQLRALVYSDKAVDCVVMDNDLSTGPTGYAVLCEMRQSADERVNKLPVVMHFSQSARHRVPIEDLPHMRAVYFPKPAFGTEYITAVKTAIDRLS